MVISAVPEDAVAMIVVEVSHEPVSIARNLREIRERNLKRGDAVSMTFDDMEIPKGLILRRCSGTSSRSNSERGEFRRLPFTSTFSAFGSDRTHSRA